MVMEDSEGMYVCTARNSEGTETASAPYTLQIQPIERKELIANTSEKIFLTQSYFLRPKSLSNALFAKVTKINDDYSRFII